MKNIKENFADEIVCIMSGSFVQRGDIAITDKYSRAKAALENGADIVVELPTVYAVSSAQTFAENGVRIAAAMNCDTLCFGAENTISDLTEIAGLLEKGLVNDKIRSAMKSGQYYPKALSLAVGERYEKMIQQPNNILAVEYIRACKRHGVMPFAIKRKGASHDGGDIYGDIASASKIRELIEGGQAYKLLTPMEIDRPCNIRSIESAVVYRLKTISPDELRMIADVSEGLEFRICEAAKQYNSLSEICGAIKTKRYTMAKIRRIIISAFLDITAQIQDTPVPYLRILAVRSGLEGILRGAKLPLIVKTRTDYDTLYDSAKEIFDADLRASEAMNIARRLEPINEFTKGVIKTN